MQTHILLLHIAVLLVVARALAEMVRRVGIPSIIGELLAGVILGPSLLNWVQPNDALKLLAELGIILLLFEVGLETDLSRLIRAGGRAFRVASIGFVLPLGLGFVVSFYLFNLPLIVALFVGGTLTATSIGVTVRVLTDLGRQSSPEGQIVLGAAVIDDVLGVLLLAVLYEFSVSGSVDLGSFARVLALVTMFFLIAPVLAKAASFAIRRLHDRSSLPGVLPTLLVSLVLFFAAGAHAMGAPELLGGFAAGIALSRRFFLPFGVALAADENFSRKLHGEMKPIIQLFTPIFFAMVGLSLDLRAVDWTSVFFWLFSVTILVVAVAGKLLGGLSAGGNRYFGTAVGMAMVPRGEVGLIFAELGRTSGIFNADVYASIIIIVAYTTLLSPFWMKAFYARYGDRLPGGDSS